MRRSSPSDLAAELFRAEPGRRLALLKAAWPVAVRAELARRSEVVTLDGEVLRIRVPDAIWRRSLWRMRRDLLARLRKVAGSAAPRGLSIVEGPVTPPVEPPAPSTLAVEPMPLPPALAEAVEQIPDDDTRARFQRAAGRYLARFPSSARDDDGPRRGGVPPRSPDDR